MPTKAPMILLLVVSACSHASTIALPSSAPGIGLDDLRYSPRPVTDGHIVGAIDAADGLDVIDYDRELRHLYLAGQADATLAIVGVTTVRDDPYARVEK
jgi:hypothetical protein